MVHPQATHVGGRLVFDNGAVDAPRSTHIAPIPAAAQPAGRIEATDSLRPLPETIAIIALISAHLFLE
jgi:hypothetical protein